DNCGAGEVTLTASGCNGGTLNWYDAAEGGNLVYTGDSYTVALTETTSFWVSCTSADDCVSPRAMVTGTIYTAPICSIEGEDLTCSNASTSFTASGGVSYSWTGPEGFEPTTGATISGLTIPGEYTVVVTDANGCTSTCSKTLNVGGELILTYKKCDVTCNGGKNGWINLTVEGGSGTYTYLWSNGATTEDINGVAAGVYSVEVTDSRSGCKGTTTVVITQPAEIVCNFSPSSNINVYAGGTTKVSVNPTGGTGPYTYWWWIASGSGSIVGGQGTNEVSVKAGSTVGTIVLKVSVTDSKGCCKVCEISIKVNACVCPSKPVVHCSYTQGFYGSKNGKACTPQGNKVNAVELITQSINNMPGQILFLGSNTKNFSVPVRHAALLNSIMPGGGPAAVLGSNYSVYTVPKKNGRIDNILLSQTVALTLNIFMTPDRKLGQFMLQGGKYLVTQAKDPYSDCGAPKPQNCMVNGMATNSIQSWYMPANVVNSLSYKSVYELYRLASRTLGGTPLPAGVSLGDLVKAISAINEAFDECRFFLRWSNTAVNCTNNILTDAPIVTAPANIFGLDGSISTVGATVSQPEVSAATVKAYPNPFSDRVQFQVRAVEDGKVTLEVFNLTGQRLASVFDGIMRKGEVQNLIYTPRQNVTDGVLYRITSNGKTFTGKLIHNSKPGN
ncbi:Ig-like domain-containing protein, partial [Flavihumibacter sp.]|uniref:Ig-like domain-containing protein n=1 Tax=Flavihumibacter sp. TaxID=1913981 RepID=UPI002FC90822